MHQRHRGLTQPLAAAYEEAASVCLNRYHAPPVEITLSDNGTEITAELRWVTPDARTQGAWAKYHRHNPRWCILLCYCWSRIAP
jgi:hypothetical protein